MKCVKVSPEREEMLPMHYRNKGRKAFFSGLGITVLMVLSFMMKFFSVSAGASEWRTIVWRNDTGTAEELQRMCLTYGIISGDVFWANGYNVGTFPPDGEVLLVPESKSAIISTWIESQNRKNGTPGPVVSVKLHGVPTALRGMQQPPRTEVADNNTAVHDQPSSGDLPGKDVLSSSDRTSVSASRVITSKDETEKRPLFAEDAPLVTVKLHGRPSLLQTQVPKEMLTNASVDASFAQIFKDSITTTPSPDIDSAVAPVVSADLPVKNTAVVSETSSNLPQTPVASEDHVITDKAVTRQDPIKNMHLIVSGDELVILTPSGSRVMNDDTPPPNLASLPPLILTPPKRPPLAPQTSLLIPPGKMMWPVNGKVSSGFGMRGKRHFHAGVDIPMPKGTPIHAAMDGTVIEVCTTRDKKYRGYGNGVLLQHPDGLVTMYAHCQKVLVKRGQKVRQGEIIALVGNTGRTTTWHVHFEVRKNDKPVNPMPYLAKR